ncbi:5058_t:CDS:2, partial [Funneliformis geosporum]
FSTFLLDPKWSLGSSAGCKIFDSSAGCKIFGLFGWMQGDARFLDSSAGSKMQSSFLGSSAGSKVHGG